MMNKYRKGACNSLNTIAKNKVKQFLQDEEDKYVYFFKEYTIEEYDLDYNKKYEHLGTKTVCSQNISLFKDLAINHRFLLFIYKTDTEHGSLYKGKELPSFGRGEAYQKLDQEVENFELNELYRNYITKLKDSFNNAKGL